MKINPSIFDDKGRCRLGGRGYPTCAVFHPLFGKDDAYSYVAAGYENGEILILHVGRNEKGNLDLLQVNIFNPVKSPDQDSSECLCIDWTPAGSGDEAGHYIVAGYYDHRLRLFDCWENKAIDAFDGHGHSDGRYIVSASRDNTLRLRAVPTGTILCSFGGDEHFDEVDSVSFSPDSHHIVSGSRDDSLKLWDRTTGIPVDDFVGHGHLNSVRSVGYSPDGAYIVSGSRTLPGKNKAYLKLRDSTTGEAIVDFADPRQDGKLYSIAIESVHFSPDGRFVVSGAHDGVVKLWDCATAMPAVSFDSVRHDAQVNSVSFSPDGRYIASVDDDGVFKLCDSVTGSPIWETSYFSFFSLCYSPDGQHIATSGGATNMNPTLWDSNTGDPVRVFSGDGHFNYINAVGFSPDGKYVVSGSDDHTLKLWDVFTGTPLNRFDGSGHSCWVKTVSFSPDGRYIVSGSDDKSIIIWSLETILGPAWFKEFMARPLILTPVWFPNATLKYLQKTGQGTITDTLPLARCGECGYFFPVKKTLLDRELSCPNTKANGKVCGRLLKINGFTAGEPESSF